MHATQTLPPDEMASAPVSAFGPCPRNLSPQCPSVCCSRGAHFLRGDHFCHSGKLVYPYNIHKTDRREIHHEDERQRS
jgi:hypothetical protein